MLKKITKISLLMLVSITSGFNLYAQEVRTIPVQDFFCDSALTGATLSPSGKYFAALVPVSGGKCTIEDSDDKSAAKVLLVVEIATMSSKVLSGTGGGSKITNFFWLSDTRIGFNKQPMAGLDAYDLWAVDADGKNVKKLVPGRYEDGYPVGIQGVLNLLKDDDKNILVQYNKRRPSVTDVYKLNIYSGRLKSVASDPVKGGDRSLGWAVDKQGNVRGYLAVDGLNYNLYHRNDVESDFELLRQFTFQQPMFSLAGYDWDGRYAYVTGQAVAANGDVIDDKDTDALYRYDTQEDTFEFMYSNERYDIGGIAISDNTKEPLFIRYMGEKMETVYLDSDFEAMQMSLEAAFPNQEVSINSLSDDESKAIVSVYSDTNPGEFYYYDRNLGTLAFVAKTRPWIDSNEMSPMESYSFEARDGTVISGYITIPKNSDGKNLPLIINPHGGPNARDGWGYNPEHQLFANRGYATISVDFRGSSGYGRSHTIKANKQWGKAMQNDVTDAVAWAIQQGIADPDKICIYGASYGGYAVMAGITFTPDLYKCAVNYVGVTDLELMLKKTPKVWEIWDEQQKVEVGDLEEDAEYLKAASPINFVDRIETPLYIVHGRLDWRVPVEHAEILKKELLANGKKEGEDFWWMVKGNEGHGFRNEDNKVELYTELDRFFASYLN